MPEVSPGNGNFFEAGWFEEGASLESAAGACGMPLMLGASDGAVPTSPGNGNFWLALFGVEGVEGVVPQGSGWGATEQGAASAVGLLWAARATATQVRAAQASAVHAAKLRAMPRCLRGAIVPCKFRRFVRRMGLGCVAQFAGQPSLGG